MSLSPRTGPATGASSLQQAHDAVANKHRQETTKLYEKVAWARRPIPLFVRNRATGETLEARHALTQWSSSRSPQHCLLLGDFGTGKTGLMMWLASELASRSEPGLTLLVPASRLDDSAITLHTLAAAAEPPLAVPLDVGSVPERKFYLLLDGLDELVGTLKGGRQRAVRIVKEVLSSVAASTRVVISCRDPAYAVIRDELQEMLSALQAPESPLLAADRAIRTTLGSESIISYSILPVRDEDAHAFLATEVSPQGRSNKSNKLASGVDLNTFMSRPFTIQLLRAVAHKTKDLWSLTTIDELYEKAVTAWLLRDQPALSAWKLDATFDELEKIAFNEIDSLDPRWLNLIRGSGLVSSPHSNRLLTRYSFAHYSFWEFFFARRIARQISAFDASGLARLDLVAAYNVNRMLVPMLLRRMGAVGAPSDEARAVTTAEYIKFLDATGWRRATGYGIHPSVIGSHDGTPSATFQLDRADVNLTASDSEHGTEIASGMSWYDAAAFAVWKGMALPARHSVGALRQIGSGMFWCSEWQSEECAHMAVFDAEDGKFHGVNPDIRLLRSSLAVCSRRR